MSIARLLLHVGCQKVVENRGVSLVFDTSLIMYDKATYHKSRGVSKSVYPHFLAELGSLSSYLLPT